MSSTTSNTEYTFQVVTTQTSTGNYDASNWTVNSENGMTDAWVNALYQALKSVTPPSGCTMQVSVTKQDLVNTGYTTSTATNPITYS